MMRPTKKSSEHTSFSILGAVSNYDLSYTIGWFVWPSRARCVHVELDKVMALQRVGGRVLMTSSRRPFRQPRGWLLFSRSLRPVFWQNDNTLATHNLYHRGKK